MQGRTVVKFVHGEAHELDNRWVVPYNRALCIKYDCHMNVEDCATIRSIKYLHKYIYKGHDRGQGKFEAENAEENEVIDEINEYVDGRYVSTSEAAWRLFTFSIHGMYPFVRRLHVHLEGEETLQFDGNDDIDEVLEEDRTTTLTAWFESNGQNRDGHHLLYADYEEMFRYGRKAKKYLRRVRAQKGGHTPVGRMYFVPPLAGERYYLRLLLNHVAGATSFEDVRTHENVVHSTFKEACVSRGLLDDDTEWYKCLEEAVTSFFARQCRRLFATILEFNIPRAPFDLWSTFKSHLIEDIVHHQNTHYPENLRASEAEMENSALWDIEEILRNSGRSLAEFHDMPMPVDAANNPNNVTITNGRIQL